MTKVSVFVKKIISVCLAFMLCLCCACGEEGGTVNSQDSSVNISSTTSNDDVVKVLEKPTVTVTSQVGNGVFVVAGYCSLDTDKIIISGSNASEVVTTPFLGKDKKYFISQVSYTAGTDVEVKALGKDGLLSDSVNTYIGYSYMKQEYMYKGEYAPVFGKDGQTHYYSALLSYSLTTANLTDQMANIGNQSVADIVKQGNKLGAETIFVVIPSSADIYPETVPDNFSEATGERLYERFEKIAAQNGAKVIYPIDTMKQHANDGDGYQIYQHTDSHWSTYGAYWGTYDLFSYIAKSFPNAKPRTLAEMDFYTKEFYGGDALFSFPKELKFENYYGDKTTQVTKIKELSNLYNLSMPTNTLSTVYNGGHGLYLNDDNAKSKKEVNPNGNGLPTALIMRDSFSKVAYDMINDRFSTVYWGEFNNYNMPLDIVDTNKVDYIIYLYSERNLLKVMMNTADATILGLK